MIASCDMDQRQGMRWPVRWNSHEPALCWCIFDLADPGLLARATCLDARERARAERFHFARDRRLYIAAHVALRECLADVTGAPAAAAVFAVGPHGKPHLLSAGHVPFNLSHSGGIGMIALSESRSIVAVGADVEAIRPVPDWQALSEAHFSPPEQRRLSAVTPARRERAFLRCWTRKEACLKALGTGLAVAPSSFTAGVDDSSADISITTGTRHHWVQVRTVLDADDSIGAVAWCTRGASDIGHGRSPQ